MEICFSCRAAGRHGNNSLEQTFFNSEGAYALSVRPTLLISGRWEKEKIMNEKGYSKLIEERIKELTELLSLLKGPNNLLSVSPSGEKTKCKNEYRKTINKALDTFKKIRPQN
jgi:hypothetical protein